MIDQTFEEARAMVGERHSDNWGKAIAGLLDKIKINLTGKMAWYYDITTETSGWAFGTQKWPRLLKPDGELWPDDPMNGRNDEMSLSEFIDYLHEWYYPRIKRSETSV